jgi:hypothetical protein
MKPYVLRGEPGTGEQQSECARSRRTPFLAEAQNANKKNLAPYLWRGSKNGKSGTGRKKYFLLKIGRQNANVWVTGENGQAY